MSDSYSSDAAQNSPSKVPEALAALLARVEAAEDFDRELDRDIGFALDGWQKRNDVTGFEGMDAICTQDGDVYADHPGGMYPSFTESMDEAMRLVEKVLPGADFFEVFKDADSWFAKIKFMDDRGAWTTYQATDGVGLPSAPIAILAALLKAVIADEGTLAASDRQAGE